jgi:AcrR family transcriptional regulator
LGSGFEHPTAGSVSDARRTEILVVARELLESGGEAAVTMRAIASRLGIRAPSLYKHFADKEAIEVELIAVGFTELAEALETAVSAGTEPLADVARAYRAWALAHPHLYRLATDRPLPRDRLPAGVEDRAARPLLDAIGGDLAGARAVWGMAHGLVSLELAGRFPPGADIDAAWEAGVAVRSPTPDRS